MDFKKDRSSFQGKAGKIDVVSMRFLATSFLLEKLTESRVHFGKVPGRHKSERRNGREHSSLG